MLETRTYGTAGRPVVLLHGGPGAPGTMAPLGRALAEDFYSGAVDTARQRSLLFPTRVKGAAEMAGLSISGFALCPTTIPGGT